MNEEVMHGLTWLPISPADWYALQALLVAEKPLVAGNYFDDGTFNLADYLSASRLGGIDLKALFDRNLLSPLSELATGASIATLPASDIRSTRVACAAATFCIVADILIEPGMAVHEYASTNGNEAAHRDVRQFRIVDNSDPQALMDIALGRADRLPAEMLEKVSADKSIFASHKQDADFTKRLRMWRPNYLYALKTVSLIRSGMSKLEAALELTRWQAEESFYNGAASLYCLAAISHTPPKGGMFKAIESDNLKKLAHGLRNATWDISIIQQFGRYATVARVPYWSFWSQDIAARAVAKALLAGDQVSEEAALASFYCTCWGKDSKVLHSVYKEQVRKADVQSERRGKVVEAARARLDSDIASLEASLGIQSRL